MSIKAVSNSQATMNLGFVTINNERYMAILHFRTDDGKNRPITKTMMETRDVALKLFQNVITPYEEQAVVEKVSEAGFFSKSRLITSHEALKTENAWKKFIGHFESPLKLEDEEEDEDRLELEDSTHVELLNLRLLNGIDEKEFAQGLYDKIFNAYNENDVDNSVFPRLTEQEKVFLQSRPIGQFANLLKGKFDLDELSDLQNLA